MSPVEAITEAAAALALIVVVFNVLYYGVSITLYVLGSLGVYQIAKRRMIRHPWMAWLPVLSFWTLGSLSDQYLYVVKGKIRNRRKWMVGLIIATVVLLIAMYIACLFSYLPTMATLGGGIMQGDFFYTQQFLQELLIRLIPAGVLGLLAILVSLVLTVLQYICYYHVFASCDPENKVLYLVLSLLFGFLLPVFIFVSRKKDLGMPPRRENPAACMSQPVYQPPVQN